MNEILTKKAWKEIKFAIKNKEFIKEWYKKRLDSINIFRQEYNGIPDWYYQSKHGERLK